MPYIDEAVITASKYDDFLRVTLPYTLRHVKRVVVVTTDGPQDEPTRILCRQMGVECVTTGLFHRRGATFAKGAAINRGLDRLGKRGWVLHLDADIILPEQTSAMLERVDLDRSCLYGIDRVDCPNAVEFRKWRDSNHSQYQWHCLVEPPRQFPLMGRYVHETDGYCPIGFFQLWHGTHGGLRGIRYPEQGNEAVHTDVQHALQWDGHKRRLIPEIVGIHLDSCSAPIGANWTGRVTPTFDPSAPNVPSKAGVKSYYDPAKPIVNPNDGPKSAGYMC